MAGICNERGRLAARSGLGAVMGSKNVKAIVVNASKNIIGSSPEIMKQVRQSLDEFAKPITNFFRTYGTTGITNGSAMSGDAPVKNWGGVGMVDFPQAHGAVRRQLQPRAWTRSTPAGTARSRAAASRTPGTSRRTRRRCASPSARREANELRAQLAAAADDSEAAASRRSSRSSTNDNKADAQIKNDAKYPYPHHTHRAEYETATSFGTMMLNNDINSLQYANHLCNQYGLDTIAAGAHAGVRDGVLRERADHEGRHRRHRPAVGQHRRDHRGAAQDRHEGRRVRRAVRRRREGRHRQKIGPKSIEFAMEVGGEELPMHDPKLQPEYYTTYKLDATPARHTQYEGAPRPAVGPGAGRRRTASVATEPRRSTTRTRRSTCTSSTRRACAMFIMMGAPNDRIPEWINIETGWDTTHEEMRKAGERIANLRMAFNVREGDIVDEAAHPRPAVGRAAVGGGPAQGRHARREDARAGLPGGVRLGRRDGDAEQAASWSRWASADVARGDQRAIAFV